MSETEEIGKTTKKETFMQSVVTLIFSQVLIKLLGLVYNLYLTNREGFGDKGNGIVSASYQIYALLLTISSIGVPNAIAKLVSERVAVGDHKGAHRIFKIAFATFTVRFSWSFNVIFWSSYDSCRLVTNTIIGNDNGSIITSNIFCCHSISYERIF